MNDILRDNLLVTMGARAAYMECEGLIKLPSGVEGEEQLSNFVRRKVQEYQDLDILNFDFFIEMELMKEYGAEVT